MYEMYKAAPKTGIDTGLRSKASSKRGNLYQQRIEIEVLQEAACSVEYFEKMKTGGTTNKKERHVVYRPIPV